MRENTARHAKQLLAALGITLLVLTVGSAYFDLRSTEGEYRQLAVEMARSFYRAINAMREWNLDHDGVYLAKAGDILPNPYLPESLRTVKTVDGRSLVMVNHSQMTRLLSELLTQDEGVHLHISSLRPLRPGNLADEWERRALARLDAGESETHDVSGPGESGTFRYMAPLQMRDQCLSCHLAERSLPNVVARGGISVSFSYAPFATMAGRQRRQIVAAHLLLFVLGAGILLLTGTRLLRSLAALEESSARVKRLEGLLPICANCKKVRLEGAEHYHPESWVQVEAYIGERTDAEFTHTVCPDCSRALYPTLHAQLGTR